MNSTGFKIDLSETFEHLPEAPSVEAVIHWRARAGRTLEPDNLRRMLIDRLPNYPSPQRQQEFSVGADFGTDGSHVEHRQTWQGFRFQSSDNRYIAQFTRNGFVFSRLRPYEDWTTFESEALRLWQIYCDLAVPTEIQRLGVRFINVIGIEEPDQLSRVLNAPPVSPPKMGLPIQEFMHQTRFAIPDYGYSLNVIQTIQLPSADEEKLRLILDLDVFTENSIILAEENLRKRLAEMRWIKNKAFFSILTPEAIERFKG
ncbi:MAG: TIGR04255 family protein [Planctomycetaceae bacterium]